MAKRKQGKTGKGGRKRKVEAGKTEAGPCKKPHLGKKKYLTLKKRTSPNQLLTAIRELKPKQIYAVRRLGFGKLLSFGMDGIPGKLAYFLVDSFNPKTMQLEVGNHKLKVNTEVVHRFLGVPKEGVDFKSLPVLKKNNDGIAGAWKSLYPPYMTPSHIVAHIKDSNDDDSKLFEIDFGMLFILTIIDCHQNGKSKAEFTNVISDDLDLKSINWCSFIIDKLKHCKESWNPEDASNFFCGPLLILLLLYVESFKCPSIERPPEKLPISFWNLERLQTRETYEIANGGFGKGELVEAPTGIHENEDHGAAVIQNSNILTPLRDREELLWNKKEFVKRRLELFLMEKKRLEAEMKDLFETSSDDAEVRLLANHFGSIIGELPRWLGGTNDDRQLAIASSFWESPISRQVPKHVERDHGGPSFSLNLSLQEQTKKTVKGADTKEKMNRDFKGPCFSSKLTQSEVKERKKAVDSEKGKQSLEKPDFEQTVTDERVDNINGNFDARDEKGHEEIRRTNSFANLQPQPDVDEVGHEKKGLDDGNEKMADHGVPPESVSVAEILIEFASRGLKNREAEVETTTSSVTPRFKSRLAGGPK